MSELSSTKLHRLKDFLKNEGYLENENLHFSASGGSIEVTVTFPEDEVFPPEHFELPAVLKPFAGSHSEVERAIWKGNVNKQTNVGATYEIALQNYVHNLARTHPKMTALESELDVFFAIPLETEEDKAQGEVKLSKYRALRQAIVDEIIKREEIVAFMKDLEENYM